jgi:hypothetical protein
MEQQEQSDEPSNTSPQHVINRLTRNTTARVLEYAELRLELESIKQEDDRQHQLDSFSKRLARDCGDLFDDVQRFARLVEEWSTRYSAISSKIKGVETKIHDKQIVVERCFHSARHWFVVFAEPKLAEPQRLALQAIMDDIRGNNDDSRDSLIRKMTLMREFNTHCIEIISEMLHYETTKDPQRTDPQYLQLWELYEQQMSITAKFGEIFYLYEVWDADKKEHFGEDQVLRQLKGLSERLDKQLKLHRQLDQEIRELLTIEQMRAQFTLLNSSESLRFAQMARR